MKNSARIAALIGAMLLFLSAGADAESWREKKYKAWISALPAEGDKPKDQFVECVVTSFMKYHLKDAESARYDYGSVALGTFKGDTERHGTPGWIADVAINGKNSYGGYVGFTPYKFIFRSGYLIEAYTYDSRYKAWIAMLGIDSEPIPPPPQCL